MFVWKTDNFNIFHLKMKETLCFLKCKNMDLLYWKISIVEKEKQQHTHTQTKKKSKQKKVEEWRTGLVQVWFVFDSDSSQFSFFRSIMIGMSVSVQAGKCEILKCRVHMIRKLPLADFLLNNYSDL